MTVWVVAAAVGMILGLGPAIYFVTRGSAVQRLIGLQLATVAAVIVLIAISEAVGEPVYLIVPLVLAALGATGTLVFTRLLRPDSADTDSADTDSADTNRDDREHS